MYLFFPKEQNMKKVLPYYTSKSFSNLPKMWFITEAKSKLIMHTLKN